MNLILIRYVGEVGIKGRNRNFFVKRLRSNIRDALKKHNIPGRVWSQEPRIFVELDDPSLLSTATTALQRVFGIASLSPVGRIPSDLEAMKTQALALADRVGLNASKSFRITARRADKHFPYKSPEINRLVGAAVWEATQARVDLSDQADVVIGIEVRPEETLIYGEVIPGPGGMPLGTQGRAFALLSGGIDSPVAAWLMMRRGCGIIPVHFAQKEIEKTKALENCDVLSRWSYGWDIKPLILDHRELMEPIVDRLSEIGELRWTCVFCKRAMIAQASKLAAQYHVQALIMGDSLGQVASQTLDNMAAITKDAQIPILRPLIAYDKQDIVALGRRIGTYDVSTRKAESCDFVPLRPLTRADGTRLQEIVDQFDTDSKTRDGSSFRFEDQ
ncbi:MAG: tRNA 4-thiouridine(8) synthase ThiI [Anaerolineae bacterium]|nr:tRNA 4-thiouridine(8) synthase ThiI [Anaerolineae bacterium]